MKKILKILKENFTFITLFFFIVSFIMPWIRSENKSLSGINLLFESTSHLNNGFNINLFIYVAFYLFIIIAIFVTLISLLIKNKSIKHITLITSAICFIASIFFIFLIKKTIDYIGIFQYPFLLNSLSYGYYLSLITSTLALITSMKELKINRGYIVLTLLSVIWIFPIASIILISFRGEQGYYSPNFIPKTFTLNNYISLFTDTSVFYFGKWFLNTLFVAVCSCIISTIFVLATSFVLSRIKFKKRKLLMNLFLVLGMFPGFMSMIAVYFIIKAMGLNQSLLALIVVYSAGSGLGYYVVKGFFDTIPSALDEAVMIDGGTKMQLFTKIIIPLSKPIIIYTILTSFIGPWCDFIFASVILGDNYESYTVAIGLFTMLENNYIDTWFTRFAAGAVIVALPIAILFISLRKFYVEGLSGSVKG